MMLARTLSAVLLASSCAAAYAAQGMEPGEWQITTTTSLPMMQSPQTMTNTQCIKPEQAKDPLGVMSGDRQGDCRMVSPKYSGDRYTWEMRCAQSGMSGTGTMRFGPGTMESEMRMSGTMGGQKMEMLTKMSGKRLGPCK
jgi:hypothetical protein